MDYKSQNIEEIVKKVLADMIGDAEDDLIYESVD